MRTIRSAHHLLRRAPHCRHLASTAASATAARPSTGVEHEKLHVPHVKPPDVAATSATAPEYEDTVQLLANASTVDDLTSILEKNALGSPSEVASWLLRLARVATISPNERESARDLLKYVTFALFPYSLQLTTTLQPIAVALLHRGINSLFRR